MKFMSLIGCWGGDENWKYMRSFCFAGRMREVEPVWAYAEITEVQCPGILILRGNISGNGHCERFQRYSAPVLVNSWAV